MGRGRRAGWGRRDRIPGAVRTGRARTGWALAAGDRWTGGRTAGGRTAAARTRGHCAGQRDGIPVVALAQPPRCGCEVPADGLPAQHEGRVTRGDTPQATASIPDTAKTGKPSSWLKADIAARNGEARVRCPRDYQRPQGRRAVTATAANSRVRYAIDRWNRRIGAVLAWEEPACPAASAAATRAFSWCASATNQAPRA